MKPYFFIAVAIIIAPINIETGIGPTSKATLYITHKTGTEIITRIIRRNILLIAAPIIFQNLLIGGDMTQ